MGFAVTKRISRSNPNEECGCQDERKRDLDMKAKYPDCYNVTDFFRIGDGVCDGGPYLKEACGWDEYNCCNLDPSKIGDGFCDSIELPPSIYRCHLSQVLCHRPR